MIPVAHIEGSNLQVITGRIVLIQNHLLGSQMVVVQSSEHCLQIIRALGIHTHNIVHGAVGNGQFIINRHGNVLAHILRINVGDLYIPKTLALFNRCIGLSVASKGMRGCIAGHIEVIANGCLTSEYQRCAV